MSPGIWSSEGEFKPYSLEEMRVIILKYRDYFKGQKPNEIGMYTIPSIREIDCSTAKRKRIE